MSTIIRILSAVAFSLTVVVETRGEEPRVETIPSGAKTAGRGVLLVVPRSEATEIYLNNTLVGRGQTEVTNLRPGTYELKGVNGERDQVRIVHIMPNETERKKLHVLRPYLVLSPTIFMRASTSGVTWGGDGEIGLQKNGIYIGLSFGGAWFSNRNAEGEDTTFYDTSGTRIDEIPGEITQDWLEGFGGGLTLLLERRLGNTPVLSRFGCVIGFWHQRYWHEMKMDYPAPVADNYPERNEFHSVWGGPRLECGFGRKNPYVLLCYTALLGLKEIGDMGVEESGFGAIHSFDLKLQLRI